MPRRCHCNRCDTAGSYKRGDCWLCWLYHNDPAYRRHWAEPVPKRPAARPAPQPRTAPSAPHPLPCVHEGQIIERCPRGDELAHVRDCEIYERCTRGPSRIRSCAACPDYAARTPPSNPDEWTRHLLYYVYPVAGNGTWQRNLDQLTPRLPLFNGRRVVAIATEEPGARHRLDPPEAVRERLGGFEVVTVRNNRALREAAAHEPLWSQLAEHAGPADCTFYAQTKGVTRPVNTGVSVHPWADLLYAANLDYWPVVAESLASQPCTGALKKIGHMFRGSPSQWHYSGSFYWMRNADIFSRNWQVIDHQWWGVETWPSLHYGVDESGCVFCERHGQAINGYNFTVLRQIIAEFREWSQKNEKYRSATGSADRSFLTA